MITPKNEEEDLFLSIKKVIKIVKRLLNKLLEKQKKHWNLNLAKQEKHFISIHQAQLKDPG